MKNILKQLISFILPVTVLILVPRWNENKWNDSIDIFSVTGFLLAVFGGVLLIGAIAMLIRMGRGTLAPWSPTSRLVTGGIYAYTRNPMISGVLTLLLAESLIFHSVSIYIWCVSFFIINNLYFLISEEPGLEQRFGDEYAEYKKNVPRWIPRTTPWKPRSEEYGDDPGE